MSSKKEYDFIVVGGGTAGLVVANRLTEDPSISVLVLEAGANALADPRVAIPALWSAILGTDLDWDYLTVPQEHLNGRKIGQPQGRLLGGSSGLNAEVFVPPSAADFDAWEALGNAGWGWAKVAPYMRKFHTLHHPADDAREHLNINWVDEAVRGQDGPIQAMFGDVPQNPLGRAWLQSLEELGVRLTNDPFSGQGTGCFSCPSSVDPKTKTRSYSASAYYAPVSNRSNLEVITGATTSKIILESVEGSIVARGVAFRTKDDETIHQVHARNEVILSAGAFGSPKLLELSGVGDKSVLEKAGIPVLLDNRNVGENLQDHIMTGISVEVTDGVFTGDCLLRQEPEILAASMKMYQEHKAGPFSAGSLTSYAFAPLRKTSESARNLEGAVRKLGGEPAASSFEKFHHRFVADLLASSSEATAALFAIPAQVNLHNGPKQIGMTTDPKPGNYLSLGAALVHPLSRGSSHITSADPDVAPTIDPRYLSNPVDIRIFAHHLMIAEDLINSAPLANFLKEDGRRAQPGNPRLSTLEDTMAYIRETALSNNHPVGTCAMVPERGGGVVDSRLKVHGVEGLRVVDSSVMPLIPRCNTQTVVYALAERAADLIKEEYKM
jgi:choline dehydrogenase-like flavoprotein